MQKVTNNNHNITLFMNRIRLKFVSIIILLSTLNGWSQDTQIHNTSFAPWQIEISKKLNKNIYDYYLLLPDEFFDCETGKIFGEKDRKEQIRDIDIKNGYIEFNGNFTMALFKDVKNKKDFIAITNNTSGRGTTCGGYNTIMEYLPDGKVWKYRNDLLPSEKEEEPYFNNFYQDSVEMNPCFKLPKVGLVVSLKDELLNRTIYNMKWNGSRFEIIKH